MSHDLVVIEADGGSRGNPGPAGYGAVVLDPSTGEVLAERSEFIGVATNNVAEYAGLIAGLEAAREIGARRVAVRMDSKLVVEQVSGRYQIKHPSMRPLAREAATLRLSFAEVTFEWIPRELNKQADRLANEAMDRGQDTTPRSSRQSAIVEPTPQAMWTLPTGPATRLVLVRHGSTAHSAERRLSGLNGLPLDAAGDEQAAALARRAATLGAHAVVSSPLHRARQTAVAIASTLGLPVTVNEDLAEVDFGAWEGGTVADARASHPDEFRAWLTSPDVAPPGGESFATLADRVRRGRDSVLAANLDRTVVVVSHVTPIKTLVRLALDAPPASMFRMYLDTASISIVDYFGDGNASLRLFNDTSHLG